MAGCRGATGTTVLSQRCQASRVPSTWWNTIEHFWDLVTFWPGVLCHHYLLEIAEPSRLLADQVFGGLVMWLGGPLVVGMLTLAMLG